jgi:hypothetical protein
MIKAMSHVVLLDLALDKNDFTRHGMHLNVLGKEKVASLIGQHLINLLANMKIISYHSHGLIIVKT